MEIKLTKTQEEILTQASKDASSLLTAYQNAELRRKQALELVCDAHGINIPEKAIIRDGKLIVEDRVEELNIE